MFKIRIFMFENWVFMGQIKVRKNGQKFEKISKNQIKSKLNQK